MSELKELKCCSRCFKVQGEGAKLWLALRRYKRQGHILWAKEKQDDGTTIAVLSTRKYPGAMLHDRKLG